MIQIKLNDDSSLKGYTLIEGFPGIGLVGPMAASYIIEKIKMEYIGYIDSDLFPPIAAIHDHIPMFPARIYRDKSTKLIIVMSEFTIPPTSIYQLSMELIAFVRKKGIVKIISIGGMPSQDPSEKAYITSSDSALLKKAMKLGINAIEEGVVAGVSAVLLTNSVQFKIPCMNLLVEVDPTVMDPKYAEVVIAALNKLIGTKIDLSELEKEAQMVEEKVKETLKQAKDSHDRYTKSTEATGPSTFG